MTENEESNKQKEISEANEQKYYKSPARIAMRSSSNAKTSKRRN